MAGLRSELVIKRGEIWAADLRPGKGFEIAKIRPVIVISSDSINSEFPLVVVTPISSQIPPVTGFDQILLKQKQTGLKKDSVILVSNLRSIDKSRLTKKVGRIQKTKLAEIEESLKIVLGLVPDL
jgi:mRNA interferase MazF